MTRDQGQLNRRGFFRRLWVLFGAIAAAEFGWLGLSFLKARKDAGQSVVAETIVTAGAVDRFPAGSVTAIPEGQFYLACLADGSLLALSRTCTHLGCSVPWVEEKGRFICPCHGSSFSLNGEVMTAPAPRPLDYYPVRIENGIVKVDISTPHKREGFEQEQATRL